jgi:endonuclease/exonuclease/phosphatase (EEP) superfamily protein YafD
LAGLHLLTGDRFIYLALLNYLAVYLFYPLPVVLMTAWLCRRKSLWIGFAIGGLAFTWFWGALYLPRPYIPPTSGPFLTVMTYNVLAWHPYTEPIIATIRAEDPDIVLLQELNTGLARTLRTELGQVYPYQVFEPADNPNGIGVISKHPIQPTGDRLPLRWIGGPQVLELQWNGQQVTLVNFHMTSTTGIGPREHVEESLRLRESQARLLADLADRSGLAILAGDANTSPSMAAYQILTGQPG